MDPDNVNVLNVTELYTKNVTEILPQFKKLNKNKKDMIKEIIVV